jgi:hypothetical protein
MSEENVTVLTEDVWIAQADGKHCDPSEVPEDQRTLYAHKGKGVSALRLQLVAFKGA